MRASKRTLLLRVLATAALFPFVVFKLVRLDMWRERFVGWGYPGWGVGAVIALEVAGLVGLWIPGVSRWAIGVLTVVLLGAAGTWLGHGSGPAMVFPLAVLLFVGLLAWSERRDRKNPR